MPIPSVARLRWYAHRARVMPAGEWVHRARQSATIVAERLRGPGAPATFPPAPDGWPRHAAAPALVTDAEVEAVRALPGAVDLARERAERILAGRVRCFGYPEADVGSDPDWSYDPLAGRRWPDEHWSRVNHRELGLDPKWIWEPARHQGVVALARAWRLTGDDRFADGAVRHIRGWIAQCPPGRGIHWRSGLELGIRLISWAFALEFLRGAAALTTDVRAEVLGAVAAHLDHLERYPSRYSSANNHLIGEAAGLAVGGLCFPEIPGASRRAAHGVAELAEALGAQVLPDGVDAEQAVGYHGFVLELGLAVVACLRRLGGPVPPEIDRALTGIAGFMATLASDGLTLPRIGDEDEGLGIDLGPELDEAARLRFRLRATAALLGADLPRVAPGTDEPTIWLAGRAAAEAIASRPERLPGGAVYPHGGYVVLRSRPAPVGEVRVVFDAGPLGLPPMAAHGHADLLAVCMSVAGREVLIDPGTFTYFGDGAWRDYGRSTAAHSTVRVDGREQAETAGRFMWRRTVDAHLERVDLGEGDGAAEGHHDAYRPVRHRRRVALDGARTTVTDILDGDDGPHDLELRWHLAPGEVTREGAGWRWRGDGVSVLITVTGAADQEVVTGRTDPITGFASWGLERRTPAPVLIARHRGPLPASLISTIEATVSAD